MAGVARRSVRLLHVATIITVVNLILAVVILVLLWRKESGAYYAATSGRPAQLY